MNMNSFLLHTDQGHLQEFSDNFRRFAEKKLKVVGQEDLSFNLDRFTQLSIAGFTGASVPSEHAGSELRPTEIALLIYEIARIQLGPAIFLSVHLMVSKLLSKFWRSDCSLEIIKRLAAGKELAAFCLTEATAGSDASGLKTQARMKDGKYYLSGEKIYITSAGFADQYLVFARTSEDPKKGISAFVVPKTAKGISFGSPEKKMGCEGSPIATVTLDDCEIPSANLVGEKGEGYKIALSGLAGGRVNIAACACALSSRAIELAQAHAKTREQFGKPIGEFQAIQFMLADMWMKFRSAVLMTREAAGSLEDDQPNSILSASAAKCLATDAAMAITTDAVQILGGAGYLKDYEVERLMRDAKMLQIVEGTNQIQRLVIARELDKML